MKVVCITGSRRWTDRAAIERVLAGAELLIVGDCPTGADRIATDIAREWDIIAAVYKADWETLGKYAGPNRNEAVAARAALERAYHMDVSAHAFLMADSKGTVDCLNRLRVHGFNVEEIRA